MREINRIVVHCSDSGWGDAATIDGWNQARGWSGIGYHLVVLNGYRAPGAYEPACEGELETGRPERTMGAHVKGYNRTSLGICYIGGPDHPPSGLVWDALVVQLIRWCRRYGLWADDVYGHTELDPSKSCPCLDMDELRTQVAAGLEELANE